MPSILASLGAMVAVGSLVGAGLALIAPAFVRQFDDLGSQAREGLDQALEWLASTPLGIEPGQAEDAVQRTIDDIASGGGTAQLVHGASLFAEVVAGILLSLVLTFFIVHDGRGMWSWGVGLLPARHRAQAERMGDRMWTAVSRYMVGVLVIATVDALLIGLALLIIGVPLVVPLAVLVFIGAFLPLVGAFITGALAALVALVAVGPFAAIMVVLVITAIQQLEGDLLYPLIVGKAIALHPVTILLVLTAGTVLAGVVGAIIAVPVAAAAWAAISDLRATRRAEAAPPGAASELA
jgi:predicted PurR-regulated permease PerM